MTFRPCITQGKAAGKPPVHFSIIPEIKHAIFLRDYRLSLMTSRPERKSCDDNISWNKFFLVAFLH